MNMLTISPINAFSDNYIWLIRRGNQGFVVDPGEPAPVLTALKAGGIELSGILITPHHFDHTGAVAGRPIAPPVHTTILSLRQIPSRCWGWTFPY